MWIGICSSLSLSQKCVVLVSVSVSVSVLLYYCTPRFAVLKFDCQGMATQQKVVPQNISACPPGYMSKRWTGNAFRDLLGDSLVVLESCDKFSTGNQLVPDAKQTRALFHSQGSLLFDIEGSWFSSEPYLNVSVHHSGRD